MTAVPVPAPSRAARIHDPDDDDTAKRECMKCDNTFDEDDMFFVDIRPNVPGNGDTDGYGDFCATCAPLIHELIENWANGIVRFPTAA